MWGNVQPSQKRLSLPGGGEAAGWTHKETQNPKVRTLKPTDHWNAALHRAARIATCLLVFAAQAQGLSGQPPPDSVVAVVAAAQGLPSVSASDQPPFGTYWGVQNSLPCLTVPLPWPPFDPSTPVYALGGNQFLVDQMAGPLMGPLPSPYSHRALSAADYAAIVQAQAAELQDFIAQVQTWLLSAQPNDTMGALDIDFPPLPPGGDGGTNGSGTNVWQGGYSPMGGPQYGSNDLWLEITNVANGLAYLNLHHGTNPVYAIWSTTNVALPLSQWQVAAEVFPTNTDSQPFTLLTQGWPAQFARAEDWTGVTSNGNTVPDWWFWFYYGTTALSDTNLDCYGNWLIYDYTNNRDPIGLGAYSSPGSPVSTCRGKTAAITVTGYDECENPATNVIYTLLTAPTNGYLTGVAPDLTYHPGSANFTGTDSFTYQVSRAWGGDSVTVMVSLVVGDQSVYANNQTVMTGTDQPVNITLMASSSLGCTNAFNYTIVRPPSNGTLTGTGANWLYTPTNNYEGTDSFDFTVSDGVWTSTQPAATVTLYVVAGPTNFTAQCNPTGFGVVLNWNLDAAVQAMEGEGLTIDGFELYRRSAPGMFTTNDIIYTGTQTNYLDLTVAPGTTNYYGVDFYNDEWPPPLYQQTTYRSPYSLEATTVACWPPAKGPVDVAFIVDNTGSVGDFLVIQDAIAGALDSITNSSGGDYRLALVTTDTDNDKNPVTGDGDVSGHDMVVVRVPFTNSLSVFETAIANTIPGNGGYTPESTDQCLNTVVNALVASGRTNDDNCQRPTYATPVLQLGDFRPAFRTNALKLVVLITDASPGGFCDPKDPFLETTNQAHLYVLEAATNHIHINAIQLNDGVADDNTPIVMQDYATTSCGWYEFLPGDSGSDDIKAAILNMFYTTNACNQ